MQRWIVDRHEEHPQAGAQNQFFETKLLHLARPPLRVFQLAVIC
jgi:hypothetical protein